MNNNRFVAEVPADHRDQGIRWLVLAEDREHSGGWFLYGHQDLDEGSEFDSWHLKKSEAENEATSQWGVTKTDWKPLIDSD